MNDMGHRHEATVAWGLLSTARINDRIIEAARESDRAEVLAVASRDASRAEAYAREHGIERSYGSYEELLADPEVEAVYISLPNSLHVEWSLRALDAGKHVLCEKPLSRHPDEVEQAFDRAEANGLVLSEAFMWRHHPQAAKLVELVAAGTIGPLRVVRAAFSFHLAAAGDVRLDPALDGGSLMDVGCYCLSAIRLLAGEPERLAGQQVLGPSGVDLSFAAALALPEGRLGHFDCGFVLPARHELEVVGEEASLFVADPFHAHNPGIELRRADGSERIAVEPANSYRLELENVSDAIRGRAPLLLGREDALGQARAIEALHRSASTTDGSAS
jgi:D-xylose 1-dehydrogenase (NADP+, D-xylono-1,5-lactone-forming)